MSVLGQQFPSRTVKIVVPTSPGGATDALSRQIGARLAELRGQPVIVENKPGANQIIGAEYVAKSAPDGNTLLVSDASSFVINPHLYRNMAYDGLRAFTPITVLVRFLAAATRERIARLPGLPTVSESGVAGYEAGTWFALVGPAGMPREVSHALYADVKKVLNEPAFKEKYVDRQWFEIVANTPEEFAAFLGTEYERWEKVIKLSGVKLE